MKRGLWHYALFACACAGMAAWWWAQRFASENAPATAQDAPVLTLHDASAYRYDENGARLDTLHAQSVHYYSDERDTLFAEPRLRREHENGHIAARAQQGRYAPDGSVILDGDAVIERFTATEKDASAASDTFIYHPGDNTLATDRFVTLTTAESTTTSTGAVWQLERNSLILKQNVRSRYEPSLRR
ncbi:MAG: LPS export ABC transporter periplasmic protein LptC [Cardiobacteriaceae bacterium]|nr:LPS export ABC transporter periplasmic protein LptC [Cardiobacteriaceae bacterium]